MTGRENPLGHRFPTPPALRSRPLLRPGVAHDARPGVPAAPGRLLPSTPGPAAARGGRLESTEPRIRPPSNYAIPLTLRTGVVFLALSGSVALGGWDAGGWGRLAYWPAGSLALVASGYFGVGPAIFGKRPDGRLSIGRGLLLLPYLILAWSVWHLSRSLRAIPPWQELTESVVIGRRLLPREVPQRVTAVVDLTSEFSEPSGVRRDRVYLSLPILDRSVPDELEAVDLIRRICLLGEGVVYIHCAEGHGRTATVAALLLGALGVADSPVAALEQIVQARPSVRLARCQRAFVERHWEIAVSAGQVEERCAADAREL